jgi:hypothetical protein
VRSTLGSRLSVAKWNVGQIKNPGLSSTMHVIISNLLYLRCKEHRPGNKINHSKFAQDLPPDFQSLGHIENYLV